MKKALHDWSINNIDVQTCWRRKLWWDGGARVITRVVRVFYVTLLFESLSLVVDCYLIFSLSYLNVWAYHCETWSPWCFIMLVGVTWLSRSRNCTGLWFNPTRSCCLFKEKKLWIKMIKKINPNLVFKKV